MRSYNSDFRRMDLLIGIHGKIGMRSCCKDRNRICGAQQLCSDHSENPAIKRIAAVSKLADAY